MNIGDSADEARSAFGGYISKYYPELSQRDGSLELGSGGNARGDRRVAAGVPRAGA